MDYSELIGDIEISDIIPIIALGAVQESALRVPRSTGLSGGDYLRELLSCGNNKRIYSVLRMQKETFNQLVIWLRTYGNLKDGRALLVPEQVAIFLWVINYSASIATTAERFQHSTETISR